MRLAIALLVALAFSQQASAQTSIFSQCSAAFSRLADPQTGTVDAEDAADLLGDEFVESQGELSRAEFMRACRAARDSSENGAGSGESGNSSDDDQ